MGYNLESMRGFKYTGAVFSAILPVVSFAVMGEDTNSMSTVLSIGPERLTHTSTDDSCSPTEYSLWFNDTVTSSEKKAKNSCVHTWLWDEPRTVIVQNSNGSS